MKPGDTYVVVEWPNAYQIQDLPTKFASMDVADRWIRAALLYYLGDELDWATDTVNQKMIRRLPLEITCDRDEDGARYIGHATTQVAIASPVTEAAYTSAGQRFDVVTGHAPGAMLPDVCRKLHIYANVCKWVAPHIIDDSDEMPRFMREKATA